MTNRETYRTLINHVVNHQLGPLAVLADMDRLHGVNISVLVRGDSGTGKEVIARVLHQYDPPRCDRPFVAINCAALPKQLLEADLGKLFLDEVGELPLALLKKLLRVLKERTIRPLGATEERQVDVQVINATNRDIAGYVQEQLSVRTCFFAWVST